MDHIFSLSSLWLSFHFPAKQLIDGNEQISLTLMALSSRHWLGWLGHGQVCKRNMVSNVHITIQTAKIVSTSMHGKFSNWIWWSACSSRCVLEGPVSYITLGMHAQSTANAHLHRFYVSWSQKFQPAIMVNINLWWTEVLCGVDPSGFSPLKLLIGS